MDKHNKNLYYLHELSDYTIDDGYPDVRGWKIYDRDKRCIGKVDNLLVNKNTERVVYLDVEVNDTIIEANHQPFSSASKNGGVHEFLNEDGENHLIVPIGLVSLDEDEEKVYSENINHQTFAETKRMRKGRDIDRDYENLVLGSYNREDDYYPEDEMFYDRDEFQRKNR